MSIPVVPVGHERRRAKPSPWKIGLAALAIAAIVFVTLCPAGLRPHFAPANLERFGAYFVMGALVVLAAGRRVLAATALVVALAVVLEAAQALAPGRDPAAADAIVKALGGVTGAALVAISYPVRRWLARLVAPRPVAAAIKRG
ncbi:hypothetical protein [Phenylobacterium sp.]|uniref:hypothetical protein n=1 Tax=Phenylobacterium sp. TaxID=1871053 RepID=UPI001228F692|nr:hypothetical protein [Phenylobacterium sp.]THD60221.1 MAG: hypothetical protein E8A49_14745 [Phenylobacterium sp.]